ncbi:MAG: GH12 family glycosyl hydrolase domain-containing protein [Cuniculiplasma sp.]
MGEQDFILKSEGEITQVSLPVKYGIIQTNMWNVRKIDGTVQILLGRNYMETKIEIESVDLKQKTIFGYPEYAIGHNLMVSPFNPKSIQLISFPLTVEKFIKRDLKLYTKFSTKRFYPSTLPFNISYDFWIRQNKENNDLPGESDCEIMIWLYRHIQYPIGKNEGYVYIDCRVNGKVERFKFFIWIGRGAKWLTISFVMDPEKQKQEISMEIPVSQFMEVSKKLMENSIEEQYIMGIELGSEFGDTDNLKMGLDWVLEEYGMREHSRKVNLLELK